MLFFDFRKKNAKNFFKLSYDFFFSFLFAIVLVVVTFFFACQTIVTPYMNLFDESSYSILIPNGKQFKSDSLTFRFAMTNKLSHSKKYHAI